VLIPIDTHAKTPNTTAPLPAILQCVKPLALAPSTF
jgi:hypothetical protein